MYNRMVYSRVVDSEVRGCCDMKDVSLFEILPRNIDEAHYALRITQI